MGFTKMNPQPGPRDEELLDREPVRDEQGKIIADAPYDTAAPGLYPNEIAVELDTGEFIAVEVETPWLGNNMGIELHAFARLIEPDGTTKLTPKGQHVEVEIRHNVESPKVERFGREALAKEMLLLVLGEPLTVVEYVNPPIAEEDKPIGWTETFEAPMIPWSPEFCLNASIRSALAASASDADELDPGALLDL